MEIHHVPVMLMESVESLDVKPNGSYIDCTVGEGGHAAAILAAAKPSPRLLGIDLDQDALAAAMIRLKSHVSELSLVRGNFANLKQIAEANSFLPTDGILFDLGISSLQIENTKKGFGFSKQGRLDMRFDTKQELSAYELVNEQTEEDLANILFQFGEEPRSRRLAKAMVKSRPIETTTDLAKIVARASGKSKYKSRTHPATQTFQALRIAVNNELSNINAALKQTISTLVSGGRLVTISYHSLEDRLVKKFIQRESRDCICPPLNYTCECEHQATMKIITKKVVKPSPEEVYTNRRSRSAHMRVAERL